MIRKGLPHLVCEAAPSHSIRVLSLVAGTVGAGGAVLAVVLVAVLVVVLAVVLITVFHAIYSLN